MADYSLPRTGRTTGGRKLSAMTEAEVEASLTDLDLAIMERLPLEGSRLGYHTLAKQVRRLKTELNEGMPENVLVTSAQLNGRLRSLQAMGLVARCIVQPANSGSGWQITLRGKFVLTGPEGSDR